MFKHRFTRRQNRIGLAVLLAFIVTGHVFLWLSPDVPTDAKIRLTAINALGWSIVLLPAWAVGKWLETHQGLNARKGAPSPTEKTETRGHADRHIPPHSLPK